MVLFSNLQCFHNLWDWKRYGFWWFSLVAPLLHRFNGCHYHEAPTIGWGPVGWNGGILDPQCFGLTLLFFYLKFFAALLSLRTVISTQSAPAQCVWLYSVPTLSQYYLFLSYPIVVVVLVFESISMLSIVYIGR